MAMENSMVVRASVTGLSDAEHMGVSLNTVKHYLTDIFNKLHVKKRDELKNFVLK